MFTVWLRKASYAPLFILVAALFAGCGGGGAGAAGEGPPVSGGTPSPTTSATPMPNPTPTSVQTANPKLTLQLLDASGAQNTTIVGGSQATLKATVVDETGIAAGGAVVKFTVSDTQLIELVPASGSALTDASGVATVIAKPKDFTSQGAATFSAAASVGAKSANGSINVAVSSATLTLGALTIQPEPVPDPLPAFNSVTLKVPVLSNGQPVTTNVAVAMTSLCVIDGKATITPIGTSNGAYSATYTNNGCTRGTDNITATLGAASTQVSLTVQAANIGAILFVSSDPADKAIVLRGSGGLGRKESALLTYKVVDQNNTGLAGVPVTFAATTNTGGLTVSPVSGVTNSSGTVTTTVSAGTIPTPVRVIASATRNGQTLTGLSDALSVSTGLPMQKFMSISASKFNIEGWDYDGETTDVTVRMADQFGNPVSDGTTVNFVSEGGAIGSSAQGACQTKDGGCTVKLVSQEFRPRGDGAGRVSILAYAQGVETFTDTNGDGLYTCSTFVDTNGNGKWDQFEEACTAGEPFDDIGDPFLDANTNGVLDPSVDKPFPFNSAVYRSAGDGQWGLNYIRKEMELVFSGSFATLVRTDSTAANRVVTLARRKLGTTPETYACDPAQLTFNLVDVNNNPMPVGTTVSSLDPTGASLGTIFPSTILNTVSLGGTAHSVTVKPDATACASGAGGSFTLKVATPKGNETGFPFSVQYVLTP